MARLRTSSGVTVEVADDLADRLVGVDYQRVNEKPAPKKAAAKSDSK